MYDGMCCIILLILPVLHGSGRSNLFIQQEQELPSLLTLREVSLS